MICFLLAARFGSYLPRAPLPQVLYSQPLTCLIHVLFDQHFVLCYSAYSHQRYQLFSPSSLCMIDRLWLYTIQTGGLSQGHGYVFVHSCICPTVASFHSVIFISIRFIVIPCVPILFYHTTLSAPSFHLRCILHLVAWLSRLVNILLFQLFFV